ncbi:ABC transporter ATP-binding protein [Mycetocola miduiensis]|uniref:ABC-2 type transport system ATP-binding protein n=1 Tax=Mycetocola miduiensis TaxID=995034 RepID=A0A1I4YVA2_9MICO|nr:ABC transporter ATP-binding protein [Mycetocola miduiensis]SFN41560.1 ABC-2 type transport system ATP-binding protein [Mycetocola miduiensis]
MNQHAPSSDTIVEVENLGKRYGSLVAVDDVSFNICRGETFALLGPNGAGKSTTIEILEGYRDRTSGTVRVLGVDPQKGGVAWKAQLGIVLQSSAEAAQVTVREQVEQFAAYYDHPRDVEEVIAAVGLTEKAKTRIGKLSGGQRRRVDVALGVIGRPQLLFLDEPTTGFDPEARRHFWELIRSLKADGTTILLTTHYLDEAAQLADRVAVIAAGKLVEIGPVDTIGGAEARVPIVRWRDHAGLHEERTLEPAALAARLLDAAAGEPRDLEIVRPSLEDVYLGLVGAADRNPASARTTTGEPAHV